MTAGKRHPDLELTEPDPVLPIFATELELAVGDHNAGLTALVDLPMFGEKRCVARLVFSIETADRLYHDLMIALKELKRPVPNP